MKYVIKMTALLLVFGLLLAGCGNGTIDGTTADTGTSGHTASTDGTTNDETTGNGTTEAGATEDENVIKCQYLPETVDSPEGIPVLKWVCLTHYSFGGDGERIWNEEAALEVNQMLADRNMPFRIQFVLLTNEKFMDHTQEWFAVPEAQEALKDADLIYAGMNQDSIPEYLTPITEYVTGTAQPSLENAVPHPLSWSAGTVEGEIYGYSAYLYRAFSSGWKIDPALLQAAGLRPEELQREFWEMDAVFAKLYAANGNRPFLYLDQSGTGSGGSLFVDSAATLYTEPKNVLLPEYYELIGSFFAVDYSQETPQVVNHLETDTTQKALEAAARYTAAGYTTGDIDAMLHYTSIYGDCIYTDTQNSGKLCIPVTDAYFTATAPEGFISGVAAVSQHKEAAVSLLSLIAEDEAFRMQLFYGKEGRDYKVTDGRYTLINREDGSNYSLDFLSPLAYFCGLTGETLRSPGTWNSGYIARDGKTALQTYQEILDNSVRGYGIRFDFTGYEQELAAIEKLFEEKYRSQFGKSGMTEALRQQLVEDLKAAGSDKILAELQRQLTQWQADHPDR